MTRLLYAIAGMNPPVQLAIDHTMLNETEARTELGKLGLRLEDLQLGQGKSLTDYLQRPKEYNLGVKDLSVTVEAGNRVLQARVVVQHSQKPAEPLTPTGKILSALGLFPEQTPYDNPEIYEARALIDRPLAE